MSVCVLPPHRVLLWIMLAVCGHCSSRCSPADCNSDASNASNTFPNLFKRIALLVFSFFSDFSTRGLACVPVSTWSYSLRGTIAFALQLRRSMRVKNERKVYRLFFAMETFSPRSTRGTRNKNRSWNQANPDKLSSAEINRGFFSPRARVLAVDTSKQKINSRSSDARLYTLALINCVKHARIA